MFSWLLSVAAEYSWIIPACRFVYVIQKVGRNSALALTSFDISRHVSLPRMTLPAVCSLSIFIATARKLNTRLENRHQSHSSLTQNVVASSRLPVFSLTWTYYQDRFCKGYVPFNRSFSSDRIHRLPDKNSVDNLKKSSLRVCESSRLMWVFVVAQKTEALILEAFGIWSRRLCP